MNDHPDDAAVLALLHHRPHLSVAAIAARAGWLSLNKGSRARRRHTAH
jgi:hypothetical protein